ncbi:HNH endonuclease signature motif containing protein [Streptomyces sp. NPDC050988]|uniref:HNH endonuclease signature motif containing protein n=1 Tax=Streptomyces sp. NPDC050988 TaxID=3365637 RepID=UPI0037963D69
MIPLPNEKDLPAGAHRYLVIKLHELYRRAGFPGIKSISNASIHLGDNCDMISHQGASNILSGKSIPRWCKLEAIVLVLASLDLTRPEPRKVAQQFHSLWILLADKSPTSHGNFEDHSNTITSEGVWTAPPAIASPPATPAMTSRIGRATSTRLKRDLRLEAGGTCPVPHCHSTIIELAYITPMARGGVNNFGNLIYLCPNHHRQFDTGDFSEQEIHLLKARLAWNLKRYTRAEHIWLWVFSKRGGTHFIHPRSERDSLRSLEADGYIRLIEAGAGDSKESMDTWCLTEIGTRLANVWADSGAPPIDIG